MNKLKQIEEQMKKLQKEKGIELSRIRTERFKKRWEIFHNRETLEERNHKIFIERFENNLTLQAIGDIFGLTRERVRQIIDISKLECKYEKQAIDK